MRPREFPPLCLATAPAGHCLGPAPQPAETGIVHIGLGNFHRAHQAVYTAEALRHEPGPWGTVGIAPHSRGTVDALAVQDQLYTVVELSPGRTRARIPRAMTDSLVADDHPGRTAELIGAPGTRIVTLTVTEKGYSYSPATLGLDLRDPAVRADLRGGAPARTVIGCVVEGLRRRALTHGAPISIVSCDNLSENGQRTRRLVTEFIHESQADGNDEVLAWLEASAAFPSTMVDRIVPATTDHHREAVARELALADRIPVPAEPFSMWVLQDDFAAGRPAWEKAGAVFTDDVHAYELLKLRLLNGAHSLIAYLGLLAGERYIADAVRVPAIEQAARTMMFDECLPTLRVPDEVDADRYIQQLFDRFGNSAIGHLAATVGSDGSLKLPVRITEAARFHIRHGGVPRNIALSIAAYLRCTAMADAYDGHALGTIRDPAQEQLAHLGSLHDTPRRLVKAVFAETDIFDPHLADDDGFTTAVAELLDLLTRHGVCAAVSAAQRG